MGSLVVTSTALLIILAGVLLYYPRQTPKHSVDLIVLVSSARENFEQRMTIRNTWGCEVSEELSSRIKLYFVVGDKSCPVPFGDRVDTYSCLSWTPHTANLRNDNQEALVSSTNHGKEFHQSYSLEPQPVGLEMTAAKYPHLKLFVAFRILHPIIIRKFGLHESVKANPSLPRIPVVLINSANQEEVALVHFSNVDPGILKDSFYYQPVETFLLPKGFEGTLIVDIPGNTDFSYSNNGNGKSVFCTPSAGSGVIYFYQSHSNIFCWSQLATNFIYNVDDVEGLERHITSRPERHKNWSAEKTQEEQCLLKERKNFSDLLVVRQTDVYRNLPSKLLLAQKQLMEKHTYSYVLKSDDDCFLNLKQILNHLDTIKYKTFWFGKFRSNWAVDRYGKWAEWHYDSVVYPKFACGSGNVFTSDISQWLANASDHLKVYQGEDVTMGIWLAAAYGPVTVDDQRWHCTKTCSPDMYSMPDLSTEELSHMWADNMNCGNPCGCT